MLYVDRFAPNVRRVLMFIDEKNIDIPVCELSIESGAHRSPQMLELNPLGQLPVLELDDGRGLSESTAICRYLEELHPDPALFGGGPTERALVEMWLRRIELGLFAPAVDYGHHTQPFFSDHFVQIAAWAAQCADRIEGCCGLLERTLATRDHVAGETFSVADVTAYCGIEVAALWGITGGATGDRPALTAWRERIAARPSAATARYLE